MAYRFVWDPRKAEANRAKHIVDFADARRVFDDPYAFDWVDSREDYGEVRYCALGMVEGHVLFVAFTMPDDDTVRIITARRAMPNEKRRYHEAQA
jgi:uncharacterized DUF497 family protein